MPVRMLADLFVRHYAGNPFAVLIHQYGRNSKNEPTIPVRGLQLLNGMARGASETVFIEAAIYLRNLSQPAREHGDRIVAAIAVTRKLDAFGSQQNVYASSIERRAKGIGMQRLPPLAIGLGVTAPAVFRGGKRARWNKVVTLHSRVTGRGNLVFSEVEIVRFADLEGVRLAVTVRILLRP
jgi:hypothetical protein